MKKRLTFLAPAGLALALVLSACGGGTPAPTDSTVPTGTPTPPPVETAAPAPTETPATAEAPVWGEQEYTQLFPAEDGALVMTVSYVLPKIENEGCPAAQEVNAWYAARAQELLDAAAETAAWGEGDYETAMKVGYDFMPFVEDLSFDITRETGEYVSVCREFYANNGGPHPNTYRFSEQFSLTDGRQLLFADFFPDQEAARDLIVAAIQADPFTAEYGLADRAAEMFQAEHFYLTDEGFVFWYQTGDLLPQGTPVEYTIPYETLSDLVALW